MTAKNKDVKVRLTEKDYLSLIYMEQTYEATRSDVVRVALENLLLNNTFVEEWSFNRLGYEFKKFEGMEHMLSNKYNFFVSFCNHKDFNYKDSIAYNLYIPFRYLKEHTGLKSYDEFSILQSQLDTTTEKDFNINDVLDFVSKIREDIEDEILEYLKERDLVAELNY